MAVFKAEGPGTKVEWSTDGSTYTEIPDVRKWSLSVEPEAKEYASSSTNGKKRCSTFL